MESGDWSRVKNAATNGVDAVQKYLNELIREVESLETRKAELKAEIERLTPNATEAVCRERNDALEKRIAEDNRFGNS